MRCRNIDIGCAILAQLMAGSTQPAIAEATGRKHDTVVKHLRAMKAKGLIYVREWLVRPGVVPTAVFALQPSPWANKDAPRPTRASAVRKPCEEAVCA